ncbi:DegT/DnrJ/EryC1/StrS family aminotransferase [Corynebacterium crudilactis]|uniref:Pyridoxal-5'-phosphate-dependent protein n=1 Tax=Corynebacterium crudilactis TaxID=1652495 RepID=A0A172QQV2_9CORY|nr:aminotransferase class I/II-fold pyridoxal phosphate-dependent enzyme [Corynebacterium crudilactis]ANE03077.1 pyridoxal-5'-phosphate-dependent protein [Corynebacterium crudilactis]
MYEQIYMSKPDVTELEEKAVLKAIRSGWVAPTGPDLTAFEEEMAQRVGVKHAVALGSGTAGLHLGLLSLGVGPDSVVVTSTMTFAATANAISYTGATPYFIDADPVSGNMDTDLLLEALNELREQGIKVSAVVPVDLLGKAVDYTTIESICAEFGIPLLADAAESLGASHKGKKAGSFGSASVVSFNGNKIMTTSGGGMLLTDDKDIADRVRYLSTQARQPVVHYEHIDIGYNYRLSNILAALGRAQLTRLDSMITKRKHWRERYRDLFGKIRGVEIFGGEDSEDNYWLTSIIVNSTVAGSTASELQDALKQENIESRPLWKPMHLQPVFEGLQGKINGTSQSMFENGLTLPSGSGMTEDQFERVLKVISNHFQTAA